MNLFTWLSTGLYSGGYLNIIKVAILTFPFLALLITFPYMVYQYHKYGSVYYLRAGIFYSFVLYLLVAYFLVILPLPSIESVKALTTPRMQLIPFEFIADIIKESPLILSNVHTYLKAIFHPSIYVVLYNILLTVPFGIYMHYYFKKDLKHTILYSFLLSLFFELTQLSGLYFIYPRGYRLFDVDDLILNTVGGAIGCILGHYFIRLLPNREKMEEDSYRLGLKISFFRRMMTYGLDFFLFLIFTMFSISILKYWSICYLFYFVFFPYLCHGQTCGQMFFHIRMVTMGDEPIKFFQLCARQLLAIGIYILMPTMMYMILVNTGSSNDLIYVICLFSVVILTFSLYFVSFLRLVMRKRLFHEVITGTKCSSTIQVPQKKMKKEEECDKIKPEV